MQTTWRVRGHAAFDELKRRGRRSRSGPVSVTWLADGSPSAPSGAPPKVAYVVSKRVGGAVVRNRVRRRLRGAVASVAADLGAGTYTVAAAPSASRISYAELSDALVAALVALPGPGGLPVPASGLSR